MSIYQEILIWSQNKPPFVQDALRRLMTSTSLSQNDIDELVLLVKKECGDTNISLSAIPLNNTHIPTSIVTNGNYPKLVSISNPINICALDNHATLQFSDTGLTVVYGNNGSGKSSYSRILRKLCWSRNPSVNLKKNVFTGSTNQQQVDFVIKDNGSNINFTWTENSQINPALKSIFVFDNSCGNVYINNVNPTEYKPVGIDILENLILVFEKINQSLGLEANQYHTQKTQLPQNLAHTAVAQWYANIENLGSNDIDTYIQFPQVNIDRKQELIRLTSSQDPRQDITNLNNQKTRINNYIQQIEKIEKLFNAEDINNIRTIRRTFESVNEAYQMASIELEGVNTLEGFGNDPWRILWNAAKNYAHSSKLSDGNNFPSLGSLQKCVLCQQDLDATAQQRMIKFSQFVLNNVSTELNSSIDIIQQKQNIYNSIVVPPIENFNELEQLIPDFRGIYNQFSVSVSAYKSSIIEYLQNGGELDVNLQNITEIISPTISNINSQITQCNQLLQDRTNFVAELNELSAKEILFNNKTTILQYFNDFKQKSHLKCCQSKLSTTSISREIGELMDNQAINLEHQEFISHLRSFNSDLAGKVMISKTKTNQGNTFQKCSFKGISDSINSILSEGEQKIIALSNFLAECTIDNRLNTIIFDDPVTSLDMDYRDKIADKIARLSQNRQIIVFTHDLYFLRLLIDTHKTVNSIDCTIIGIDKYNGTSGIVTDEIPYLAKNVQERITSIKKILQEHDALPSNDAHGRETKLDSARKRFRMLLERSVEEILSNKTYERFSKIIHLKKGYLSSYIVAEQKDVDFLLRLFGKYSVTEHDGGISTIPQLPNKTDIEQDIIDYSNWKNGFKTKLDEFNATYNQQRSTANN